MLNLALDSWQSKHKGITSDHRVLRSRFGVWSGFRFIKILVA